MATNTKTALVTGGAGFIGSHLTEALVAQGYRVTVVDNLFNSSLENLQAVADQVEICEMDMHEAAFAEMLETTRFESIFHMAANAYVPPSIENPAFDFRTNLLATFQLLETIRQAKLSPRLIVASSAAVYGNPDHVPIVETDPTVPISPYGVGKLGMERYVHVYSQIYGIRAASLRFFSVFGPRQHKQIVYDFIKKITNNPDELVILGDGTQMRDMVYVEDVVQAIMTVHDQAPLQGEVFNVAVGKGYSTREMAETMTQIMNVTPKFTYTGSVRPGDCDKWIASIDLLKELGYDPRVSLKEGMRRTIEWYQATH
jgi:UDP-glucose 4-epimerase